MGAHNQYDVLFAIAQVKRRCYGNRFWARIGENWQNHLDSVRCDRWEDRNMDASVNTANDPSTADKDLVNFWSSKP